MRFALAIDLGGSHASLGLLREHELMASREISAHAVHGLQPLLPHLQEALLDMLSQNSLHPAQCSGIAFSLPSLVDFHAGKIVSVNDKYPDATALDLNAWARASFGLPLVVENDARAALLGEAAAGAARGYRDALMLTLGTGIGCAVLANGIPFRTSQPQGGNLGGHIPVRLDGRPCTCGAVGCMESEASGWALPLIVQATPGFAESALAKAKTLDFATVFQFSDAGDPLAQKVIAHCFKIWSIGLVGLVHAYGPQIVVVGGGVASRKDLPAALEGYVQRYAWAPGGPVKVVRAELGNHAPLYAAHTLLQEHSLVRRLGATSRGELSY